MNDDFDNEDTDREMSERFVEWRQKSHTPTPWITRYDDTAIGRMVTRPLWEIAANGVRNPDIEDFEGIVWNVQHSADARRIVACVNALRDVSTAALEELVKEERELELALTLSTMMKSEPSSERSRG